MIIMPEVWKIRSLGLEWKPVRKRESKAMATGIGRRKWIWT